MKQLCHQPNRAQHLRDSTALTILQNAADADWALRWGSTTATAFVIDAVVAALSAPGEMKPFFSPSPIKRDQHVSCTPF